MANHQATGKKAKYGVELSQRVRAAVLGAFEVYEKRTGKLISQVLSEELENNPLRFIELASKVMPKELDVSGHIHQTIEHRSVLETDSRIEDLFGNGKDQYPAPPVSH